MRHLGSGRPRGQRGSAGIGEQVQYPRPSPDAPHLPVYIIPIFGLFGKNSHMFERREPEPHPQPHRFAAIFDEPLSRHPRFAHPLAAIFAAPVLAEHGVGALPPFGIAQRTVPQRLRLRPGHYVTAETLQFFEISAVEQLVIVPAGRGQQIGFQHNFRIIRFGCCRQRSSRNACSQTSVRNGYARFR